MSGLLLLGLMECLLYISREKHTGMLISRRPSCDLMPVFFQ